MCLPLQVLDCMLEVPLSSCSPTALTSQSSEPIMLMDATTQANGLRGAANLRQACFRASVALNRAATLFAAVLAPERSTNTYVNGVLALQFVKTCLTACYAFRISDRNHQLASKARSN